MKSAATSILCALAALVLLPELAVAREDPQNLGGGLRRLVATSPVELARPVPAAKAGAPVIPAANPVLEVTRPLRYDASGRVLVRVSFNGTLPFDAVLRSLDGMPGVEVTAMKRDYGNGLLEAWVLPASLKRIATAKGVLAVVPEAPGTTDVGAATTQGVIQHRIDKIPQGIDGDGITVGVLSDSYDTSATPDSAALDIATGDLPGNGNPFGNTEPVVVLQDRPGESDEGRAMLQIVHDLAPKARLGFATAFGGVLSFAENIRSLAGLPGAARAVAGFKADVIVDDVIYEDEPFFQDGILARTVDEVATSGVMYFASAGSRPGISSYDAAPSIVPGVPASWAATNLNFSSVPRELYAGGFHNFTALARDGTIDIAQTVRFSNGSLISLQWNEPFESKPPTPVGPPLAQGKGTVPPNGGVDRFTFEGTAGQVVQLFVDADNTTTGHPHPDLTFDVLDPNGNEVAFVDSTTVPESLLLAVPATGTYTVVVGSFQAAQFGDYQYRVQRMETGNAVRSDYNLLFFTPAGDFIGALSEANTLTNRPLELGGLPGATLQVVIARGNSPGNGPGIADRLRWVGFGGVQALEYFNYLSPVTFGHSCARGAMSVAAYPFFAPFVPEPFTSPGSSFIYFDSDSRPLPFPQIRAKPDFAAMDGANTTFFGSDSSVDADSFPNFFGTSAAAAHAAAIAALMLDAAGGPGRLSFGDMHGLLQASTFRHDIDPFFIFGTAFAGDKAVSISASADASSFSQFDPNVFAVSSFGADSLKTLSIDASDANPTQTPRGLVFDERSTPMSAPVGQPFVVGRTIGLNPADVTASFSRPANPPGEAGQWQQVDLVFAPGAFRSGALLQFGVDRDQADAAGPVDGARGGNSVDLLGDGVLIPSGEVTGGGARFFGKFENGGFFSGVLKNKIARGFSHLDGAGFIDAEVAIRRATKRP